MGLFRKKFTLLVICKANITRSAYIHGYMDFVLREHMPYARKKMRIMSAGVRARGGSSAHQVSRHVARINGFSLRDHRSTKLTKSLIKKADAVLVMETWQRDEILKKFPKTAAGKTFRMTEYCWHGDERDIADIPDPTGQDTNDYREFVEVAHAEVDRIFRELGREGVI